MKKHITHTINQFKNTQDRKQNKIDIKYFYYQDLTQTYRHNFKEEETLSDIRSISKTVLALVAGIVYDEKITYQGQAFNKDFLICPVIKNLVNVKNEHNYKTLNKVTIDHLLSHTIGFDQVLMMRNDIKHMHPDDYLNYIVNTPIMHHPGEQYLYSNAGYYLLSVVLQELLNQDLLNYIYEKLFKPLGIIDYQWEYYGDYLAGATRLWLYPEDLAKIGKLNNRLQAPQ